MNPFVLLMGAQLALAAQGVDTTPTEPAPSETAPTETAPAETVPAETVPAETVPAEPATADEAPEEPPAPVASGPRFYVVDPHVVNLPEAVSRTVSSAIAQALEEEGFRTFTRDDVREIFGQASDLAVIDADADHLSLGTLGQAVGAEWLVAAVVTKLGDGDLSVQMRLIDVEKATAAARRETRASDFGGDILAATKDAARLVLAPLFAHMKGALALSVSEEGADVLLDGQQIGVSPIDGEIALSGGHHVLTVAKTGFVRHQETLRVEQGTELTRAVTLRPSRDFLEAYRARNGLYRTVAWTTTGVAALFTAAGLAGGGVYVYSLGEIDELAKKREAFIEEKGLNYEHPVHKQQIDEEFQGPLAEAKFRGELASVIGLAAGAVAVLAIGTTAYFWIFGDDPGRYDTFAAEYGIE